MHKMYKSLVIASLAALGVAHAVPAAAQATSGGLRMPYEAGFWGHVGLSLGRSEIDANCFGGACDDRDNAWRVFGGGRFNNTFGGEIGFVDFGDFSRGNGRTEARGLDLAVTAGWPIATNTSVFGKLGMIYARGEVSGTAAGLQTGRESGWGPRLGVGAQIGLTQNWAIRADWDRYRVRFPGGRDSIDTLTIGAQYSFR